MRFFAALLGIMLLLIAAPAFASDADCTGLQGGPRVCEAEGGYGDPDECEENTDSFNTHMRISAIWVEVDDSTRVRQATYESCLRADRIGVDREVYSASVWVEEGGEETTILDYTYRRENADEACSVIVAEQVLELDPDVCMVRGDVHAHDVLP